MSESDANLVDRFIDIAMGTIPADPDDHENRTTRRCEHDRPIGFVQMTPTGGKSIATVVRCKNISPGGMCVVSRYMLHVGHIGAVLMRRANGDEVMLGVKVVHCEYVGDMKHESGLEFVELLAGFAIEDFRNEQGYMPQLKQGRAA